MPHPNAVRLALETAREQRQQLPPVATQLSERARSMDVTVRHHGLDTYDALRPGNAETANDNANDSTTDTNDTNDTNEDKP